MLTDRTAAPRRVPPALALLAVLAYAARRAWSATARPGGRRRGLLHCSIAAACSTNLRAVNWRTVGWGIALQLLLALFILKFEVGGVRPGYEFFDAVAGRRQAVPRVHRRGLAVRLRRLSPIRTRMGKVFAPDNGFVFAFTALPTIIFVSSFFTVLYYFGILQFVVRLMARAMM